MDNDKEYFEKRDKALYSLNVKTFKKFLQENDKMVPDFPNWFLRGSMAKMILKNADAPENAKIWAREVLSSLGWGYKS